MSMSARQTASVHTDTPRSAPSGTPHHRTRTRRRKRHTRRKTHVSHKHAAAKPPADGQLSKQAHHDPETLYIYFVHVPKTAGSAVKYTMRTLEEQQAACERAQSKCQPLSAAAAPGSQSSSKEGWTFYTRSGRRVRIIARGHCPARRFPSRGPNVFKVATIREPVERFLSAYNFVREGGINHPDQGAVQQARNWSPFLQKFATIDDFVKDRHALRTIMSPRSGHTHFDHLMPWVCDKQGRVDIDLVIRQEHASADFGAMCQALDLPIPREATVHKRNVTGTRSSVSKNTRQSLQKMLRQDIRLYRSLLHKAEHMQANFETRVRTAFADP